MGTMPAAVLAKPVDQVQKADQADEAGQAFIFNRAIVIEDWAVVRRGLQAILATAGVATEGMSSTANEGFASLSGSAAGLVVLGSVADQTQRDAVVRAVKLGRRVLVLVGLSDQHDIVELYRAGALAVVPRTASDRELATAVQHVLAGEAHVASALVDSLFSLTAFVRPEASLRFPLTPREHAVLALLASGRSNREIAHELCIGFETVKTHVGNLFAKLDVESRSSAVRVAIHHGLV